MEIEIPVSYHSASKPSIKAKLVFIADSVWAVQLVFPPPTKFIGLQLNNGKGTSN